MCCTSVSLFYDSEYTGLVGFCLGLTRLGWSWYWSGSHCFMLSLTSLFGCRVYVDYLRFQTEVIMRLMSHMQKQYTSQKVCFFYRLPL